jgi:hypothetical protein
LWFEAMRRGDFAAAWDISDAIIAARAPDEQCWHLPRHEQWVWDGRPLDDQRVLVRCYHGLGDTIQFARFLRRLDVITRDTTVWAQAALLELLATLPGTRRLLPLHDGTPEVEYDVDIEIMELAHAFRATADSVGAYVPYFNVVADARPATTFAVGVAARAGDWDARRSIPADLMLRVAELPRLTLFNLQVDPPLTGIPDLSTPDVTELARRLRALDLVITPDTMLAHLAGALAVRTWTLLPADADWRWMSADRTSSPWYPTMRLFRQRVPGDWSSVIDEVVDNLSSSFR